MMNLFVTQNQGWGDICDGNTTHTTHAVCIPWSLIRSRESGLPLVWMALMPHLGPHGHKSVRVFATLAKHLPWAKQVAKL